MSLASSAAAPTASASAAPTKVVYHRAALPGSTGARPPPEVFYAGDPRIDHLISSANGSPVSTALPESLDALSGAGYGMASSQHTLQGASSTSASSTSLPVNMAPAAAASCGYSVPLPAYGDPSWKSMSLPQASPTPGSISMPAYGGDALAMGSCHSYRTPTFNGAGAPSGPMGLVSTSCLSAPGRPALAPHMGSSHASHGHAQGHNVPRGASYTHSEWQALHHSARQALLRASPTERELPETQPTRSRSLSEMDPDKDISAFDDGEAEDHAFCEGCCGRDMSSMFKKAGAKAPKQAAKPMTRSSDKS